MCNRTRRDARASFSTTSTCLPHPESISPPPTSTMSTWTPLHEPARHDSSSPAATPPHRWPSASPVSPRSRHPKIAEAISTRLSRPPRPAASRDGHTTTIRSAIIPIRTGHICPSHPRPRLTSPPRQPRRTNPTRSVRYGVPP